MSYTIATDNGPKSIDELRSDYDALTTGIDTRLAELENLKRHVADRKGNDPDAVKALDRRIAAVESLKAEQAKLNDLIGLAEHAQHADERGDLEPGDSVPVYGYDSAKLSPLAADLKRLGFDPKTRPTVTADGFKTLKAATLPAATNLPRRQGGIVPMGTDTRWVYPLLPSESAGTDLVVQDFRQTARSVTGTVERSATATTDKAELNVTLESVTEAVKQQAIVIPDIPNAMMAAWPQLSAFLQTEGVFQLNKSLDAHVLAQITAATPPNSAVGSSLIEKIRKAVTAHRALGADPTILVVSPVDAESLDLVQTADGAFLFGTSGTINASPMWKLKVVESTETGIAPHLIDPTRLGVLYVGQIEYAADPYTGFKKNLTTLRIEVNSLFHVRDANGAYVVEA